MEGAPSQGEASQCLWGFITRHKASTCKHMPRDPASNVVENLDISPKFPHLPHDFQEQQAQTWKMALSSVGLRMSMVGLCSAASGQSSLS